MKLRGKLVIVGLVAIARKKRKEKTKFYMIMNEKKRKVKYLARGLFFEAI